MLLSYCHLETLSYLINHGHGAFLTQQHDGKLYNIVNQKVYIPMGYLLALLLLESAYCVGHDVTLSADEISYFVNRILI